ncbi:hypothetical protein MNBD_NITROSPINAE04-1489 [hydrothermal vent metagenome]|uniref:Uncharacterized protein n=1 Tax=hydrothermal vent metagenome TaxID=652676 RepID=A0A3B1DA91_9ZZZZ
MKAKNELTATDSYVSELVAVTKAAISEVATKNRAAIGHADIIKYAKSVKEIHESLVKNLDQAESHSKVVLQFLSQWNNLVLGVFYSSDIVKKEKVLSKRQYDIFVNSLEEIIKYGKKYFGG